MNTPTHNILITINATAEQLAATDALYEIIGPELKANEELKYKFNTFFHSNLNGQQLIDAFAKVMQPAIARLANNLGETLSLPLYMSLARHITTEWVQKPDDIIGARMQIIDAEPEKKEIAQLDTAQVRELITDIDPEAPRPALPVHTDSPLARGSAGQDRSKPVLNARVLRGFDNLVAKLQLTETGRSEALPVLTKGDKDAQTALKYLERMVAWAKEKDRL